MLDAAAGRWRPVFLNLGKLLSWLSSAAVLLSWLSSAAVLAEQCCSAAVFAQQCCSAAVLAAALLSDLRFLPGMPKTQMQQHSQLLNLSFL